MPRVPRIAQFPVAIAEAKMKYVQLLKLTQTVPNQAVYNPFWQNGLYDPNAALGGHQPMGFDQIAPLYNHYQVVGAKIKVTILPPRVAATQVIVGITDSPALTLPSVDPSTLLEDPDCKYVLATQDAAVSVSSTFKAKQRYPGAGAAAQGASLIGGSPSDGLFWNVWMCNIDSTNTTAGIDMLIEIDYTAIFWERVDLAAS